MKQLFESERISFMEVSELLVRDYLVMVNDYENVNRFIGSADKTYTEEMEIKWVHKKPEEKAPVFSMIEKRSGRFIGNIELMDMTDTGGELGIAITAEMQDRGYGTEAVAALVEYGFRQYGLKRIFLRTNPGNARLSASIKSADSGSMTARKTMCTWKFSDNQEDRYEICDRRAFSGIPGSSAGPSFPDLVGRPP